MELLNILLTLMDEEQLRRDSLFVRITGSVGHLIVILFHREVPEGNLVICTGRGED